MRLLRFECRGFRSLQETLFEPSARINVIYGDNAQGKTSLLEAILFAATSKSHRTSDERDLVKYGEHGFHLRASAERQRGEVRLEANWWDGAKRFKVNGVTQTRLSDILGKITVVLFSPDDITLVKGSAASRRKFIDMELSQISPNYLNALQRYRQALRQRNELLRKSVADPALLDVWDSQLAEFGAIVIKERQAYLAQLGFYAANAYARIADGETLDVTYQPDIAHEADVAAVLAKTRTSDIRRQMTTRGPHRDDMDITVAGQSARSFASQGQQKTAALTLKLAELDLVKDRTGEFPALMLDEVLSELDNTRSRRLFETLDPAVQCLVTTTDLAGHKHLSENACTLYRIERGQLEKEK